MKRMMLFAIAVVLAANISSAQYLETDRYYVGVHASSCSFDPGTFISYPTFDVAKISTDNFLDIAVGQNLQGCFYDGYWYGSQFINNGTGQGWTRTDFYEEGTSGTNIKEIRNAVFGKLRPGSEYLDLAVPRIHQTEIYRNNDGNGIVGPNPVQTLNGQALDAAWGPFDRFDNWDDLAVTSGSEVRIYQNMNGGYVSSSPYATFTNIAAQKILLAEMKTSTFTQTGSKAELIAANGATFSVWLNNNADGLSLLSTITLSQNITSFAVGDLNNDGFNDVVVAYANNIASGNVSAYLNNGTGALSTTPVWTATTSGGHQVAIGDLGKPGDGTRNDGWNDIVVVGRYGIVSVFINQTSGSYFTSSPQQTTSAASWGSIHKVLLADVQNLGGLSVIYATDPAWYIGDPTNYGFIALHRHTGNPAPAPPQALGWGVANGHPVLSWRANTERDLAAYQVWRSLNSTTNFILKATVPTNSYTDNEVMYNPNFKFSDRAYYYVKAVDNATPTPNISDASNMIEVPIAGIINWKRGASESIPAAFNLSDAYPNPFNPSTQIKFDLPEDSHVSLVVFDVLGRKVGEIVNGNYAAGYHSATWNPSTSSGQVLASGVYFARFTAIDANGTVKSSRVNKLLLTK
jgi:hypothetical protein